MRLSLEKRGTTLLGDMCSEIEDYDLDEFEDAGRWISVAVVETEDGNVYRPIVAGKVLSVAVERKTIKKVRGRAGDRVVRVLVKGPVMVDLLAILADDPPPEPPREGQECPPTPPQESCQPGQAMKTTWVCVDGKLQSFSEACPGGGVAVTGFQPWPQPWPWPQPQPWPQPWPWPQPRPLPPWV